MQYLLLIYRDERDVNKSTDEQRAALRSDYMTFTQEIVKSGHFRGGDALQSVTTATTVRAKDGKVVSTDGPFAETKEQLGGYYLVEAKDLDEAVQIASRIPNVRVGGSIEVRPIMAIPNKPS